MKIEWKKWGVRSLNILYFILLIWVVDGRPGILWYIIMFFAGLGLIFWQNKDVNMSAYEMGKNLGRIHKLERELAEGKERKKA